MVEKSNRERRTSEENSIGLNRRRFVKALGTVSSATAFGTLGSASAMGMSSREKPDIKNVTKGSSGGRVKKARSNSKYDQLETHLRQSENLRIVEDDIEVYARDDVDGSGSRYVVSFPMTSTTNEDTTQSGIGVTLRHGLVQSVSATKVVEIDGKTRELHNYKVKNGEIQEETATINIGEMKIERSSISQEELSTRASFGCDACFAAGNLICAVSCGAPISVICSVAGISTVGGGVACATFATLFCGAIIFLNEHSSAGAACAHDAGIECACRRIGAGNCIDNSDFPADCT